MIGSGLWRTLLLRLPVADPLVSGLTECSMLWCGLLILIYVICRMKCESLQSIDCFFLYPAFWLVLFPRFWLANRPVMATSDWSDFLAVDWLTMEHISILLPPDYILKKQKKLFTLREAHDFTRCITRSLVLCVCFVDRYLSFVLFLLAIVLSVPHQYANSDYPFDYLQTLLHTRVWWSPCCSSI
jgi:hypothetical protein